MESRSVVGKPISLRIPRLDEGRCCMNYEFIPELSGNPEVILLLPYCPSSGRNSDTTRQKGHKSASETISSVQGDAQSHFHIV